MRLLIQIGLLFVGGTFALTFGSYFLSRQLLGGRSDPDARELASSTTFRIAALHGLLLALVFAEELSTMNGLKQAVAREANQLESIFHDLDRFGGQQALQSQRTIALYVQEVLDNEWPLLNEQRRLSPAAGKLWDQLYGSLLNLPAADERKTWLRGRMLSQVSAIGAERNTREIAASTDVSPAFWIVAFFGIAAIAVSYLSFAPHRVNMVILTVYASYVGVVLFFIKTFDFPFSGPTGVQPVALQILYDQFLQPLVQGAAGSSGG